MRFHKFSIVIASILAATAQTTSAAPAPSYAGQETREIKAMSPDDVQAYLSGRGMGLAKAAELNGYPGPSHALALSAELNLSSEQVESTQVLFAIMEAKAIKLGQPLVEEERNLDKLFSTKAVDAESLEKSLARIGELQAKVRQAHLEAHLAQVRILTPEQVTRYMQLRGYASAQQEPSSSHHQH